MTSETAFPDWIEEDLPQIKSKLVPKIRDRLDKCREEFQGLLDILGAIPEGVPIPEVSPDGLERLPPPFGATLYGSRYWIEQWYFRHVCRLRAYLHGLQYAMESGNWPVGISSLRNAYEEIIYFDYHLKTVKKYIQEIDDLGKPEDIIGKNIKKKLMRWGNNYNKLHIKIVECLSNSLQGTGIDWKEYTKAITEGSDINHNELNANRMEKVKRIHINDCIRNADKEYPHLSIKCYYDNLSEMCHPNLGSNMLVFSDRKSLNQYVGGVTLSSEIRIVFGACMFFEMACEPMISAFSLENENMVTAKEILDRYQDTAKYTHSIMKNLTS